MEIKFGKHKGEKIEDLLKTELSYCKWIYSLPRTKEAPYYELLHETFKNKGVIIGWGRHKNKTIEQIASIDPKYLDYLYNNDFVKEGCRDIIEEINKLKMIGSC